MHSGVCSNPNPQSIKVWMPAWQPAKYIRTRHQLHPRGILGFTLRPNGLACRRKSSYISDQRPRATKLSGIYHPTFASLTVSNFSLWTNASISWGHKFISVDFMTNSSHFASRQKCKLEPKSYAATPSSGPPSICISIQPGSVTMTLSVSTLHGASRLQTFQCGLVRVTLSQVMVTSDGLSLEYLVMTLLTQAYTFLTFYRFKHQA